MNAQAANQHLFDLKAEIEAVAILRTLIFELKHEARSSASFDRAIDACESLCKIAQVPDHYLGMELIKLLSKPHGVSGHDIASMVNAFMYNITTQIDFYRLNLNKPE